MKKGRNRALILAVVRPMGLEPIRSPIRPSNVRVCLFRHGRTNDCIFVTQVILSYRGFFCNSFSQLSQIIPDTFFY